MKRICSFLLGVSLGALAGSTIALLFAPSSGKSFQSQIGDAMARINQEVSQAAVDKRQQMETELSKLRASKFKLE